jgi:hypothetical protein
VKIVTEAAFLAPRTSLATTGNKKEHCIQPIGNKERWKTAPIFLREEKVGIRR